jgi:hypothetical protein
MYGKVTIVALSNTSTPTYAFANWRALEPHTKYVEVEYSPLAHTLKPEANLEIDHDSAVDGAVM